MDRAFLEKEGEASRTQNILEGTTKGDSLTTATCHITDRMVLTPRRWILTLSFLFLVSLGTGVLALRFGAVPLSFQDIGAILLQTLTGHEPPGFSSTTQVILLQVRLPRLLLGFLVGGCLALSGVGLQALLRNPLADPYVLGISSGAALGAALATLLGIGSTFFALSALPLCAMGGGIVSVGLVYGIAQRRKELPTHSLLLAGVILNAIFSALIMFITSIMEPTQSFGMMQWLMGSLTGPSYPVLLSLALYLLVTSWVLLQQAQPLNLLTLGDETAQSVGLEVARTKKIVFLSSAMLTGAVVAFSGMIGFVGLVIPHAVRLVIGPDHRLLMPAAALIGGSYLIAADTLARTLLAPSEIPVGIITALVGGPLFIYLLTHQKNRWS